MRRLLFLLVLAWVAMPAHAQEVTPEPLPTSDIITVAPLIFGRNISDTITDSAVFDRYTVRLREGERLMATITPDAALAPLLGVADASGEVIARSDADENGDIVNVAQPGETVTLEYVVPEDGEYALVVSRAGLADGTTTGQYTLVATRINSLANSLQAVEFRCEEALARTALTLEFSGEREESYQVKVYGLDGFQPAIRAVAGPNRIVDTCSTDSQYLDDDEVRFPGEDAYTTEANTPTNAELTLNGGDGLDIISLQIGSIDGRSGRYMLVINGFHLANPSEENALNLRLGPAAIETEALVYMVRGERTRLDPVLELENDEAEVIATCDDAGRLDCDDLPPLEGGAIFNSGERILGGMLDAGLRIAPGDVASQLVILYGRNENVTGPYAVVILGELPE